MIATSIDYPAILVSVIVPVYNSECYIRQCLDSVLAQTHSNLELICVDDGSSDSSPDILSEYSAKDERVRVITQCNAGPGIARNVGLNAARGKYVYFLDADDFCTSNLLAKAVSALERTDADIAVFAYNELNAQIDSTRLSPWAHLLDKFDGKVVTWRDNPDWLFHAFQNLPWNKVLRLSFLRENSISFQDIRLTEDLMFSAPALVLAGGIVVIDEPLVTQRVGTGTNTMSNKSANPLDFIQAFKSLKSFLEKEGLYDQLEVAYAGWAVNACIYNLHTMDTYEGFAKIYNTLKSSGLAELGLLDLPRERYQEGFYRDFLEDMSLHDVNTYLYGLYTAARDGCDIRELHIQNLVRDWTFAKDECLRMEERICDAGKREEVLREELEDARLEAAVLRDSTTWKVGSAATALPRALKRKMQKR